MTGVVTTIRTRCRRCYTCVRNCPAKAIKVEDGQAQVIAERCIGCGGCVKACAQSAKRVQPAIEAVEEMLNGVTPVVLCLAPSFPASFPGVTVGQLVSALKELGFSDVVEVAFGAELVAREHAKLLQSGKVAPLIASACPALISYVEKYMPELVPNMAPIVSPMVAMGRVVKQMTHPGALTVFAGPCVAKKAEAADSHVQGAVDASLTFEELHRMLGNAGIDPSTRPDSEPGGPRPGVAAIFAVSGGLSRAARIGTDLLDDEVVVAEGKDEVLELLGELSTGKADIKFADLLFCQGCVGGPVMGNDLGMLARERLVVEHVRRHRSQAGDAPEDLDKYERVSLHRTFGQQSAPLEAPSEDEIAKALRRVNKLTREDELNCGACGYSSCREKAIAVCQGLAESEMCLPYLVEQLQENLHRVEQYQTELEDAQSQLVQSERLASMGQLAAAVAHEVNNPLAIALLNAHLALDELDALHPAREAVAAIVGETARCKQIVSDLLDFARLGELQTVPIDVRDVVSALLARLAHHPSLAKTEVVASLAPTTPVQGDVSRIERVLLNLMINAGEAMPDGGMLTVSTSQSPDAQWVRIAVRDTGQGIPPERMEKLFTPFFSTKRAGKGTGLGLSIAYGIVKRHGGIIEVESMVGQGSTFTVVLPVASVSAG